MARSATALIKKNTVAGRVEREYRLYRIVAGEVGETCKAVAYLGMGGIRPVEAVEATSVDEAVSLMKDVLEARLATMRLKRRDGIPSAAEFHEALAALPAKTREELRGLHIERLDPLAKESALATLSMRTQRDAAAIVDELRKAAGRLADLLDAKPAGQAGGTEPLDLIASVEAADPQGLPVFHFHDAFRKALVSLPPERPAMMVGRR